MSDQQLIKLKIDEEFQKLIPPLSPDEYRQLEETIIRDGCREPLSVWNAIILDGYNRYEICTRLQISFSTVRISLKNREEAAAWICANQLCRSNISEEAHRYLIGKRYDIEKIIGAHNAAGTDQYTRKEDRPKMLVEPFYDESASRTAQRLGEEYHLSYATVCKYGIYAQAIDALAKTVPELIQKVLSGQVKISQENIIQFSRLSPQDVRHLSDHLSGDTIRFVGYSGVRKVFPEKSGLSEELPPTIPAGSVKDMPAYDPDAEISSLTLTIPSWKSLIDRTRSVTNLTETSSNARCKLEEELVALKETIDAMLMAIKEDN
jgi:hypothetical protein